jgi:glycosyltransferase involved in cell wall biosynthesis
VRTLHIINTFSPATGGPPEVVRNLIRAYQDKGADIEVVCLDNPDAPFLEGISCPLHALGRPYFGRYAFSPRLWQWLRQHAGRFDAIVMHGIWTFPGVAVRFAARRSQRPYGIFVHGALDPWFDRQYPLKYLKKLIYWPVQYPVLRDAKAVFFTAESERELAMVSYRPNRWQGVVVPYGTNDPETPDVDASAQIAAFYGSFPELRGRRFLLFLARIHTKKGCDLLIEAFAKIANLVPAVDLVIAGPDQEEMQERLQLRAERLGIASRIHWPGMIAGDVKWGALRACDALVLSSHSENFGIAVVECLAMGRPVLISNQVNIWAEIQADGVGLVEDDTLAGTERLLRRWFDMPSDQRESMAARARSTFKNRYTMDRTAAAIEQAFSFETPVRDSSSCIERVSSP